LNFSSARDVALEALATFRQQVVSACAKSGDDSTAKQYQSIFVKVVNELRFRYESEKRLRDTALFDAYEDAGSAGSGIHAARESLTVERLILGNDLIGDTQSSVTEEIVFNSPAKAPANTSMDFVLFHEPMEGQDAGGKVAFADIEGLGAVLEGLDLPNPNIEVVKTYNEVSPVLGPFLDTWDALSLKVDKKSVIHKTFESNVILKSPSQSLGGMQLPFVGSDSAADAMSTFFEFSAAEKSRLQELSIRFFPSQRSSRKAFIERFCWARFMEVATFSVESIWERSVPDGNRDVRSRLPTTPCFHCRSISTTRRTAVKLHQLSPSLCRLKNRVVTLL
jgi:hypothetical protein